MQPPPLKTPFFETLGNKIINSSWAMWFNLVGKSGYVTRDPADWDFEVGAFTTNGAAQNLDLSSIIGKGVKLVHFRGAIQDDAAGSYIAFYDPTQTNANNTDIMITEVANVHKDVGSIFVRCNADGVIKYVASNVAFVGIWLTVRGWWVL